MTSDIAIWEGGQVDGYRPQIMTPEAAAELDRQLRLCTRAVLKPGTDYGVIPGTGGEQVLFRPGAQKLLQWFQLSCTCDRVDIEHDDEGRKHGITYRAIVTRRLPDGNHLVLATCEGTADYDEDKFYQSAETARAKAENKERGFAAKDGRRPNPAKWMNAAEYRAPWNTLMKRAQKRAIVGAVIDATAAGGVFKDDDDSPAAPADGGPSWYQQALGAASVVALKDDANRLWAEAAQAKLDGLCTADQATHVQNRIRLRMAHVAPVVIDAEDLAANAAAAAEAAEASQDTPPAETSSPAAIADDAAGPAGGETAGDERRPAPLIASGQKDQLKAAYERLYDQDEEGWGQWLHDLARLAGLQSIAAPTELTQAEAKRALDQLKGLDVKGLRRLLDNGEVPDGQ